MLNCFADWFIIFHVRSICTYTRLGLWAHTFCWNGFLATMMTSWNGNIFGVTVAICAGNSLVTGEFPPQRPVTRSFDVFFYLRLNKRLSKQSWGWWSQTPSRPLWHHCNDYLISSAMSVAELKSTFQAKLIEGLYKCDWIYSTRPHYVSF